jgi:hypothetical protein
MIFVARQLQEKSREQRRDLYVAFIDLSKAFDTVNRELLWRVLVKFGVPPGFLGIIRSFHDGMVASVQQGGLQSDPFSVAVGVKQGCVLAPVIFNMYLVAVTLLSSLNVDPQDGVQLRFRLDGNLFNLRRLQAPTKVTVIQLLDLQYADDCALVAHSPESLQRVLNVFSEAYSSVGLRINANKTKILAQPHLPLLELPVFSVANEEIEVVEEFKYLGSVLTSDCCADRDVQARIHLAAAAFGRFRQRVFENRDLRLTTKIAVYRAVCVSTLLYGSETWTVYRRHVRALEAYHIKCLQRIMGITWRDKVPHNNIYERAVTTSLEAMLRRRQLRWLGHVCRMTANRLPRQVLYGQLHAGDRAPGGQRKRFKDDIKHTLRRCEMSPDRLEGIASDRAT